jgi:hypothetical protein
LNRPISLKRDEMRVQNVKPGSQLQQNKRTRKVTRQQEFVREGNLVYLNASSRLACQLDEARRQLDRLERHANRMLRSVGAH